MKLPKTKYTLTGTHFTQNRPVRTGEFAAPTNPIPEGRGYIRRMGWGLNPGQRHKVDATTAVASIRKSAPQDCDYYLDTCFLVSPMDVNLWEAILSRRINLTPLVYGELQAWLTNGSSNIPQRDQLRQLIADGSSHVRLPSRDLRHGHEYYASLLMLRKLRGYAYGLELEAKHGRLPTKDEFYTEFKAIDKAYNDRAFRIAYKGYTDFKKSNYAADEQMVTMAVINALATGRETVILTRDHDIMEQFYKIIYLMDTHYRGMLFAERYHANPGAYQLCSKRSICEGYPNYFDSRFCGDDDAFLRPNLSEDGWNDVLPTDSEWVNVSCTWFGDGPTDLQIADMTFCADRDMLHLLEIKKDTGGLNTDLLRGKNCHIWPAPELSDVIGVCVAIAEDRLVEVHPQLPKYRALDMMHSLRCNELFDNYVVVDPPQHFPFGSPQGSEC